MRRSPETSCRINAIGNSGASASGPTGSRVPGCSGGGGGAGRSGTMLYHSRGISDSWRTYLTWFVISSLRRYRIRGRSDVPITLAHLSLEGQTDLVHIVHPVTGVTALSATPCHRSAALWRIGCGWLMRMTSLDG